MTSASKHIPQRTCVACRKVKDKKDLIRVVRIADKGVEVDIKGKTPGRGAYICRTKECWQVGCEGGRLEHTLKTSLTRENREKLIKIGEALLAEESKE